MCKEVFREEQTHTLDSGIDVGKEINEGPRKFDKKNKRSRTWKIWKKN